MKYAAVLSLFLLSGCVSPVEKFCNDQAIEQHLKSPHDNPAFMFGALGEAVPASRTPKTSRRARRNA